MTKERKSKSNKYEKRKIKKEKKEKEWYDEALKDYSKEDKEWIKSNKNIYVRSDGILFCVKCMEKHGCGMTCWCCTDEYFENKSDMLDHLSKCLQFKK